MPKSSKASAPPLPAAAKPDAGAVLNKARAAFDQYRKKMTDQAAARKEGWGGPAPGFPPGMPFPPGMAMPPWGPPPPAPTGTPYGVPWPVPGPMVPPQPAVGGTTGPLFESVGQMLQLGVAFATAAFAGGLQVMQGFAGPATGGVFGAMPAHGGCHPHPHGCGDDCGHAPCGDCGRGRTCDYDDMCGDCCRPGVRNCSCGCC